MIIDATLKKNINFKTLGKDCPEKEHEHHGHPQKDGDLLAPGETRVRCGDVRHCHVEIPFCTLVEVKLDKHCHVHADELRCYIHEAVVSAQVTEIPDRHKHHDADCETFDRIIEKDVVRIVVKVERTEQLLVQASECPEPEC